MPAAGNSGQPRFVLEDYTYFGSIWLRAILPRLRRGKKIARVLRSTAGIDREQRVRAFNDPEVRYGKIALAGSLTLEKRIAIRR